MARVKNTQLRAQHCQVYIHVFIPKYIFPTCYFCLNLNVISTQRENRNRGFCFQRRFYFCSSIRSNSRRFYHSLLEILSQVSSSGFVLLFLFFYFFSPS